MPPDMADSVEVRFDIPREDLEILDGYVAATGKSRTDVMRGLLGDWSRQKRHEAILICRTAGINPREVEGDRK